MFVSKNLEQASGVLDVWVKAGIQGATILDSSGLQPSEKQGIKEDIGILFSIQAITRSREVHHRTLLTAIKDEEMLNRVVEATTQHIGDWSRPDVGVMFVWPLTHAYGLDKIFNKS
ncbi:MAG TPA: hypothetical protein VK003_18110 [Oceanobacillus sp.]|nr:hypothetical protein [Oceanobacillus sp.]